MKKALKQALSQVKRKRFKQLHLKTQKTSSTYTGTPSQYRTEAERRAAMKADPDKEPERYKRFVNDYEKSLIKVNEK